MAEGLASNQSLADRIDIFEIEQFVALNLYELGKFAATGRKTAVTDLVVRYNQIVDEIETDPSLRIEFRRRMETPEQRSRTMRAVKDRDSQAEMTVRRLLHGMGYRYRPHRSDLPGKPDIVFPGRRKVIFVHGCFWHGHSCHRGHGRGRPEGVRLEGLRPVGM